MDSVLQNRVFRSKVGWVIFLPLILSSILAVFVWYKSGELSPVSLPAFLLLFTAYILLSTNYRITADNQLIVKTLFIKTVVDISNIKTIGKQTSILSAPALSFDRIEIAYNRYDEVVISPKEKEEFIAMLKSINPAIEVKL